MKPFLMISVLRRKFTFWLLVTTTLLAGCWTYVNKEAMQAFQNRCKEISVTVYPVNVVKGNSLEHDGELASKLVHFLQNEQLANAVRGNNIHTYAFKWGSNQAAMAKRSAEAFAAQVGKDKIDTDYALLVEVLCDKYETRVMGVEYYLVDRDGKPVDGMLSNSDWPDFRAVNPKNRNDGVTIAENMLRKNWQSNNVPARGF